MFNQNGRPVGSVDGAMTSLVSHQARRACASRYMLRGYLKASELTVPEGKVFPVAQVENALEYLQQLGRPVNIRPVAGQLRSQFSTGISTEDQLAYAWESAAEACAALPAVQRQILVERYQLGIDLRIHVVGEEVTAAVVRLPFYVVGDGESDVGKLHEQLVAELDGDPYLQPPAAEGVESFLTCWGKKVSYVPKAGEILPLGETSQAGAREAITVDVLNRVSSGLRDLAVDAVWAFPGLGAASVDLRVRSVEEPDGAVILGVDPAPDISEFRYPTYGQYRRVSTHMINHMVRQAGL